MYTLSKTSEANLRNFNYRGNFISKPITVTLQLTLLATLRVIPPQTYPLDWLCGIYRCELRILTKQ